MNPDPGFFSRVGTGSVFILEVGSGSDFFSSDPGPIPCFFFRAYSLQLGYTVNESTVRGIKKRYLEVIIHSF